MTDFTKAADQIVAAYNAKDFERLRSLLAPNLKFRHLNRDFALDDRDEFIGILTHFAGHLIPGRRFEPPERVTAAGDVVVRESWWVGDAVADIPGMARAGEEIRLKFCTVYRFDENGILAEWIDYG